MHAAAAFVDNARVSRSDNIATRASGLINLFLVLALVGCGAPGGNGSGGSGHYVGGGEQGSVSIAFDAGPSGITGLTGQAVLGCIAGNYTLTPFSVNSTIPLAADGSFSTDQTLQLSGSVTTHLRMQGKLDGSGHASGTVTYGLAGVCDSGNNPIQWTAAVGGTTSTAAASTSSCSPTPCGTNGGVTLSVTGLTAFPPKPDPSCPPSQCPPNTLLEMTFTVTNGSQGDLPLETLYQIQPGSGQSVDANGIYGYGGYLPDGHTCSDNGGDLQPGAHSNTLVTCFSLTSNQVSQPLKLMWAYGLNSGNVGGTIDLSGLSMQTGPAL